MMVFRWIEEPFSARGTPWWVPACAGMGLLGFGILLVVLPQILSALVAALVISAGISLLHFAWISHPGGESDHVAELYRRAQRGRPPHRW